MVYPYNSLLFRHEREEEAIGVLTWNKPQGILLRKQNKLKMATRNVITNGKTKPYVFVYILGKIHKLLTVTASKEK